MASGTQPPSPSSAGNVDTEAVNVQASGSDRVTSYIAMVVLFLINLLNYMDRYIIAGVLNEVQKYFSINDNLLGLLQTVLTSSYMMLAPLFGYLGDRYNRKILMGIGIVIWCSAMLAGSFVNQSGFWLLILCLAIVGLGQASYSTIAPTIIADLFVDSKRTWALSFFYIAIPVGSGLGYILGSSMLALTGDWHWALRVTPCLGALAMLLLMFLLPNPSRGGVENHTDSLPFRTSWWQDLKYLLTNWSFMLSSFGAAAVTFTTGILAFWGPLYLVRAQSMKGLVQIEVSAKDSMIFGAITCVAGILAIGIGAVTSKNLRKKNPQADPLICAVGLLIAAPFLLSVILAANKSIVAAYVCIFLGEMFLGMNWSIVSDILLYVVIPSRRSMAEAVQITISHVLGDASSPYIIGAISNALQKRLPNSTNVMFMSLQYSLLVSPFIAVIGGSIFLWTANHIEKDQNYALMHIQDLANSRPGLRQKLPTVPVPEVVS
ncbi:protein spinster homolog 1-like isoform X2 [Narcine bancroftii]|uniref:protein spinster homolog 1-like isoform X2 n=1 Tax=Narcine bancroftii TaxID=1343680 RepID=UPI003831C7F6